MLYAGEKIYSDLNAHELTGDGQVIYVGGEPRYLTRKPRRDPYGSIGATPFELSGFAVLSREEIKTEAIKLADSGMRISDGIDFKEKDQDGMNWCWGNGVVGAFECRRSMQGLPKIEISPASGCGPITGYKNVGGWGEDMLKQGIKVGFARTVNWGDNDNRDLTKNPAVQDDYLNNKIIGSVDGQSNNVLQLWTLLVRRVPCFLGLDWWGHLIYAVDVVVLPDGSLGTRIRNSWGKWGAQNKYGRWGFSVLTESKSRGDFCGITQVTSSPT